MNTSIITPDPPWMTLNWPRCQDVARGVLAHVEVDSRKGEAIQRQLPGLVGQSQSLHPGLGA